MENQIKNDTEVGQKKKKKKMIRKKRIQGS